MRSVLGSWGLGRPGGAEQRNEDVVPTMPERLASPEGKEHTIQTQHLPNAAHLNSAAKHRVTLYGFLFSQLAAQTLILQPESKELFKTK